MNPFTSADAGQFNKFYSEPDNKGSICVSFHELGSSAPRVLCTEGDDKEVRLDYVLSIFTHSAVNNSDN